MMKGFVKKAAVIWLCAIMLITGACSDASAASAGYKFTKYGVTVTMNGKAASLIKKAGTLQKKKSKKSCAYNGKDRTYQYKDFILYTYSKTDNGTEYVSGITFRTKNVSTKEGIKIGSSESKVLKAYKNAESDDGLYTLTKGKSKLQTEVENGKVTKIRYVAL